MYQLLRAGANLDSEFFPESINRRSWPDAAAYAAFLKRRKVDYVIVYEAYDRRYETNEHQLLDALSRTGAGGLCTTLRAAGSAGLGSVDLEEGGAPILGEVPADGSFFFVYHVRRAGC
jgi:hypothetical protein